MYSLEGVHTCAAKVECSSSYIANLDFEPFLVFSGLPGVVQSYNLGEVSGEWDDSSCVLVQPGENNAVSLGVPFDSSDLDVRWDALCSEVGVNFMDDNSLTSSFSGLNQLIEHDD